jgi:hypothetical protein
MTWSNEDIRQGLIREFASGSASRRDDIRLGIYRAKKQDMQFFDSGITYAKAFQKAYGRPLEMRIVHAPPESIQQKDPIADLEEIGDIEDDPDAGPYCTCGAMHSQDEIDFDCCDSCGKKVG